MFYIIMHAISVLYAESARKKPIQFIPQDIIMYSVYGTHMVITNLQMSTKI